MPISSRPTHMSMSSQTIISSTLSTESLHNLSSSCSVSATYCLPIPSHQCTISPDHVSQYTISPDHVLSVQYTLSLLAMSSQHTMLPTSLQPVHCPFCPFPVSTPISPAYVQSNQEIICPCTVSTLPHLPMISRCDGVLTLY